ncbi:MAG TPA: hypothetical protein VNI60_06350 [Pyrinomonadaceae bacterium]|nr:hypothetical protein [Pyrinomonadaceae bacterium]
MKRFYSQFRIMLMTFALGLASVFLSNGSLKYSDEVSVNLPRVKSSSVFEIITKENWKGYQFVGQGCGGTNQYEGETWVTAYRTNDWKSVSIGGSSHDTAKETTNEFNSRIRDAFKILEISKKRAIIENKKEGDEWIDIIYFEDRKSLRIITASELETAVKFESWKKSQN